MDEQALSSLTVSQTSEDRCSRDMAQMYLHGTQASLIPR